MTYRAPYSKCSKALRQININKLLNTSYQLLINKNNTEEVSFESTFKNVNAITVPDDFRELIPLYRPTVSKVSPLCTGIMSLWDTEQAL